MNSSVESEIVSAVLDLAHRLQQQLGQISANAVPNLQEMAQNGETETVFTLAGQNEGAKMKAEEAASNCSALINIYVNNNVQGVNNSILCDSTCSLRDPGVHLKSDLSSQFATNAVPDSNSFVDTTTEGVGRKRRRREIVSCSSGASSGLGFQSSVNGEARHSKASETDVQTSFNNNHDNHASEGVVLLQEERPEPPAGCENPRDDRIENECQEKICPCNSSQERQVNKFQRLLSKLVCSTAASD